MIKNQNYSLLALFSFVLLFTFSCQREGAPEVGASASPQFSNLQVASLESSKTEYTFEYTGQVEAGILTTGLNVLNGDGESILNINDLQFNMGAEDFNQSVANTIADVANSKSTLYNPAVVSAVADDMYNFLKEVTLKEGKEQLLQDETQGVFFLYSLLRAIERSHAKGGDPITATPFEGYALGISSFLLMEDVSIDVADFQSYIANDPEKVSKGAYVFEEVLQQQNRGTVSLKELGDDVEAYIANAVATGSGNNTGGSGTQARWWPSGSDHGCCGNYSGPCLYWHWACYVHDKMCTSCEPSWFCLPGCVPD